MTGPRVKEILNFTQVINDISTGIKTKELPLLMKLHSNSEIDIHFSESEGVNFEYEMKHTVRLSTLLIVNSIYFSDHSKSSSIQPLMDQLIAPT